MSKFEETPNTEINLSNILNQISNLDESEEDFEERKQTLLRQVATFSTNENVEIVKENSEDEQVEDSEIDKNTLKELTERVESSALSPEAKESLLADLNEILKLK